MVDALYDVAVVGGGPAGSTAAAFCAERGLRTVVIERENFPREKVCGDCLNPACWPILHRLGLAERVRDLPHAVVDYVEFIDLAGHNIVVELPRGENAEIATKRSLFDGLLLERARELGAEIRDRTTLTGLIKNERDWKLNVNPHCEIRARVVIAADGRNSTVARLLDLLPRPMKERIALQAHVPLPDGFGNRIVLQWLPGAYSGQVPVNEHELNVCLVGRANSIPALKLWATNRFQLAATQTWRSITPLTRAAVPALEHHILLVGDAARVVEPFTGEGIFYAMRSGEIAGEAADQLVRGNIASAGKEYIKQHRAMYRGRLSLNGLARLAVISPRAGAALFRFARSNPAIARFFTARVVS